MGTYPFPPLIYDRTISFTTSSSSKQSSWRDSAVACRQSPSGLCALFLAYFSGSYTSSSADGAIPSSFRSAELACTPVPMLVEACSNFDGGWPPFSETLTLSHLIKACVCQSISLLLLLPQFVVSSIPCLGTPPVSPLALPPFVPACSPGTPPPVRVSKRQVALFPSRTSRRHSIMSSPPSPCAPHPTRVFLQCLFIVTCPRHP